MDSKFLAHVKALKPKLDALLSMKPYKPTSLPRDMPDHGVYDLSEGDNHLYIGRSNEIKARLGRHSKDGAREESMAAIRSYRNRGLRAEIMRKFVE